MHRDRYIFLINQSARAILCSYVPDSQAAVTKDAPRIFKTLDPDIKKDDYVIVPTSTRHGFTVVRVKDVDVDVDVKSDQPIGWIAGVFEKPEYDRLLTQEQQAMQKIRSAELRKEREDLRKNMLGMAAEELGSLAIADMSGSEPKPPPSKDD